MIIIIHKQDNIASNCIALVLHPLALSKTLLYLQFTFTYGDRERQSQ